MKDKSEFQQLKDEVAVLKAMVAKLVHHARTADAFPPEEANAEE